MFQLSVIIQIRECGPHGQPGRPAVGTIVWLVDRLIPDKKWREHFDAALRRALTRRQEHLTELALLAQHKLPGF